MAVWVRTSTERVQVPRDRVVHVRINSDLLLRGGTLSPISAARATGRLLSELESALGDEGTVPVGRVVGSPEGPNKTGKLQKSLNALRGKLALVETTLPEALGIAALLRRIGLGRSKARARLHRGRSGSPKARGSVGVRRVRRSPWVDCWQSRRHCYARRAIGGISGRPWKGWPQSRRMSSGASWVMRSSSTSSS